MDALYAVIITALIGELLWLLPLGVTLLSLMAFLVLRKQSWRYRVVAKKDSRYIVPRRRGGGYTLHASRATGWHLSLWQITSSPEDQVLIDDEPHPPY